MRGFLRRCGARAGRAKFAQAPRRLLCYCRSISCILGNMITPHCLCSGKRELHSLPARAATRGWRRVRPRNTRGVLRHHGRAFPPHPSPLPWGEGVCSTASVPGNRSGFPAGGDSCSLSRRERVRVRGKEAPERFENTDSIGMPPRSFLSHFPNPDSILSSHEPNA
jgi:hypothetical protein